MYYFGILNQKDGTDSTLLSRSKMKFSIRPLNYGETCYDRIGEKDRFVEDSRKQDKITVIAILYTVSPYLHSPWILHYDFFKGLAITISFNFAHLQSTISDSLLHCFGC